MDGGGEWGGVAFDASSGLLYVNANEMAWIVRLAEREMPKGKPATGRALYEQHCAACHGKDLAGNPPEFPSLVGIASRRNADEVGDVVRDGRGRMPGNAHLSGPVQRAIVRYVVDGTSQVVTAAAPTPFDLPYTLDGYARFTDPDGFPAVKPPWGTLTAIDMNRADRLAGAPWRGAGLRRRRQRQRELRRPGVTASGLVFIGATK